MRCILVCHSVIAKSLFHQFGNTCRPVNLFDTMQYFFFWFWSWCSGKRKQCRRYFLSCIIFFKCFYMVLSVSICVALVWLPNTFGNFHITKAYFIIFFWLAVDCRFSNSKPPHPNTSNTHFNNGIWTYKKFGSRICIYRLSMVV